MDRQVDATLLVKLAKHLKYVPTVIAVVKNWPTYLLYYLGIRKGGGSFIFRNGATLQDREGTASGTIAVVFIRRHYGSVAGKSTIVDIGANVGAFTIYAASTNHRARVFAYEPVLSNYELLVANIVANDLQSRVVAFNKGVGSRSERRDIYLSSSPLHSLTPAGGYEKRVSIECLSLADVLEQNCLQTVELLKINAEGAEYEILYAAPRWCLERIEEIRLEYHKQSVPGENLDDLVAFLRDAGFVVTSLFRYADGEGFLWAKKSRAKLNGKASATV